jgi:hypothetical protein
VADRTPTVTEFKAPISRTQMEARREAGAPQMQVPPPYFFAEEYAKKYTGVRDDGMNEAGVGMTSSDCRVIGILRAKSSVQGDKSATS